MVMEQDRRMVHWREADGRDANLGRKAMPENGRTHYLAQVAHIRASRAHNWTDLTSNSQRRMSNLQVGHGTPLLKKLHHLQLMLIEGAGQG